jgi:hypothetical protein
MSFALACESRFFSAELGRFATNWFGQVVRGERVASPSVTQFGPGFAFEYSETNHVGSGQWSVVSGQWSVVSRQSLVVGCWLLVVGCWELGAGRWELVVLDFRHGESTTGRSALDLVR